MLSRHLVVFFISTLLWLVHFPTMCLHFVGHIELHIHHISTSTNGGNLWTKVDNYKKSSITVVFHFNANISLYSGNLCVHKIHKLTWLFFDEHSIFFVRKGILVSTTVTLSVTQWMHHIKVAFLQDIVCNIAFFWRVCCQLQQTPPKKLTLSTVPKNATFMSCILLCNWWC